MDFNMLKRARSGLTALACFLGLCTLGNAAEPTFPSRQPAPVTLPSGWFSEGTGGQVQLVAHDESTLSSSRRNAAERLEFIRQSVIVEGEAVRNTARSTKPLSPLSLDDGTAPAQGLQPIAADLPSVMAGIADRSSPTPSVEPSDAKSAGGEASANADEETAPVAAMARRSDPSQVLDVKPIGLPNELGLPATVGASRLTPDSMEDLPSLPIVDRGTSRQSPSAGPRAAPSRANPIRQQEPHELATESMASESSRATSATDHPNMAAANDSGAARPEFTAAPATNSPSIARQEIDTEPFTPTVPTPSTPDATIPTTSAPTDVAADDAVNNRVTEPAPPAVVPTPPVTPPAFDKSPELEADAAPEASDTLFSAQIPSLSFSTHGPRTIVVGKPATYLVRMTNSGATAADNVNVKVQLPAWADVVKSRTTSGTSRQEPGDDDRSVIRWQLEKIERSQSETLELTLIPRNSQPFELGVGWTFAPPKGLTQIQVQEPRLDLTVVGPREVLFGEKKIYTLTVSNPGTGTAENVTLQLLPIVATDRTGAVRKLGDLQPGAREIIELELTARQAGTLEVKAIAAADGNLQVAAGQEVMVRRPNLKVVVDGPTANFAGTPSRYVVRIDNNGDAAASEVVAAVRLPAGARSVAASRGGRWDEAQGTVHWQLDAIPTGEHKMLQVQCDLMTAGDNRVEARVSGAAEVSASHSVITQVESVADLKLFVNDPKGVVAVGADAAYEVRIVNRGTKAAEDIQLVGYFSEGIEPVSIEGWRGQLEEGQVVMQPIRRLHAGQEMVFKITARALTEANHVFRAELTCANPETRLATEEWTRYFGHVSGRVDEALAEFDDRADVNVRR